ncbi:helix-turn-helix domain-containing protein [Aureimonas pseudogalii]|uniref:AraC-like DNA-binding protein n=1 Tax=Aureimonas pseudogalii TaxID=1744844 RepID=A0A7W6H8R0_9HYPH|nr:helix-turn-helix domain-containing protein [Aureimonas pseudogalii]MBB4000689.1 AraC-like DNA-binding protein [Aureimonas pseudogalii]
MQTPLQFVRISSTELGSEHALCTWKSSLPQYQIDLNGLSPEDSSIELSAWLADTLIVGEGHLSPMRVIRDPLQLSDGCDHILFKHCLCGSWHGEADGRPVFAGAGDTICMDTSRPFRLLNNSSRYIFIIVPRDKFPQALLRNSWLHGSVLRGVGSRLLSSHLNALLSCLPSLVRKEALRLTPATVSLLLAAMGETEDSMLPIAFPRSTQPALQLRVERHIERNLSSPDLVPDAISRDLNIPRSSLYRAFTALGGLSNYIQTRRLDVACALLFHPEEHRSIREIAETLGFDNTSTFSNAFRRRFGCSPREARSRKSAWIGDTQAVFRHWCETIRSNEHTSACGGVDMPNNGHGPTDRRTDRRTGRLRKQSA